MSDRVLSGDTLSQVEALVGLTLPPDVLKWRPLGPLVVVVTEPVSETTASGRIIKTPATRAMEEGGAGYIVSVGPEAGERLAEAAGTIDIVGLHAVWGRHAGEALVVFDTEDDFKTRFRIIKEEHLLLVEPLKP